MSHTFQPSEDQDLAPNASASNLEWVEQRLLKAFPNATIQVIDTRGDDQHLSVIIASSDFTGKTRIGCHQMVYAVLEHMRNGYIHAMSLKTLVP